MSILGHLSPAPVWIYFEEICKIPRTSRNEINIRRYLLDFAIKHNLEAREDKIGNILIVRSASPGMENKKVLVLQSHMDMVGEKNADHPHNWLTDPITPVLNDGWVTAGVTTLGADDGIGIAAQLALLTDKDLKTGKIECLFTVDEESGMTGALNLDPDFFSGRILLNLDSEDEGILYIGCAGGMDTVGTMNYQPVRSARNRTALEISVTGLHGGHSGDEIHKGYGNSVKLMNRILRDLQLNYETDLSFFDGGNLRNAIPRESFARIVIESSRKEDVIESINSFALTLKDEFGSLEPDLKITTKGIDLPEFVMTRKDMNLFLDAIACCPHGAIAWSKDMTDLVETSTNLASAKFFNDNSIKIVTTQRSSIASAKKEIASAVASCLKLAGAEVVHSDGYPGWKPNMNSEILRITRSSYLYLFGKDPQIRAIHAGLECGLIYEKIKGIDMISFGPTIRGAHTPEEMIEIKTVQMFWDLLVSIIKNIPMNS